jgi:nicotinamidase/pyrazinamidase
MLRKAALLVVDVQLDFCPGGALPVPKGDQVVQVLNRYIQLFWKRGCPVIASRDWHPVDSGHFQSGGGRWPVHCVQQTRGAQFHPELMLPEETIIVSKGMGRQDEGYSALEGVLDDGTPVRDLLHRLGVKTLYVGGLATDYCVKASTLDALKGGFQATLLTDAIRGVELKHGDSEAAVEEMIEAGAELANLESIGSYLLEEREETI